MSNSAPEDKGVTTPPTDSRSTDSDHACTCCGRVSLCEWAGCIKDAAILLHMTRPCGHQRRSMRSCNACAERCIDANGGRALNASTCPECGDRSHVEGHRGWPISVVSSPVVPAYERPGEATD